MDNPFASEIWDFLATEENIALMISSTEEKKAAITKLVEKIEEKFEGPLSSKEYPQDEIGVFINNMIKQIMEHLGYSHIGCGLCPGKYIRASGLYERGSGIPGE
ncbi:MAG: hypothetical protein GX640_16610 [Fibrobacter sp.]|nr:hypothetical protein [Fibrobacter sp.]